MRNTLKDLHNHLFEQLERLNDESLKGEALKEEMERAKAMSGIATKIIENGNLVIKTKETFYRLGEANPNQILGD